MFHLGNILFYDLNHCVFLVQHMEQLINRLQNNIQIHYISPGLSKHDRLGKDQYMFAIYMPKDKIYFVKDYD